MLKLCPSWEKPIAEGNPCTIFRRELAVACPELPEFLSKARKQPHDVHSKETKVQFMLACNQVFLPLKRRAALAPSAEPAPTWERVLKDMKAMKPHFADCAEEAAQFASAWSGGDKSPALLEVEAYAKQLKVRREPEKDQLGFLASAKLQREPKWLV